MNQRKPNRTTLRILFLAAVAAFGFSCSHYDARWFTQHQSSTSGGAVIPPDAPVVLPPADQDPFEQDTTPKPNDGGFSASQFDDWRIKASFDKNNVPTYKFEGNGWVEQNLLDKPTLRNPGVIVSKGFVYNGPNTVAGTNNISNVKYYQFKKQHPLFGDDFAYNKTPHAKRLERFYFYWFEGDTAAPHLSNALIAVDTHSKLVFAYAKPTQSEKLIASEPPLPTRWGPFEAYSKGPGDKAYNFYEYDPIGYVKADGTVVLYDWYPPLQGSGQYDPRMAFIGGTVASTSGPGRSPYAPVKVEANDNQDGVSGKLTVRMVRLTNVSSKSHVYKSNGGSLGLFGIGAVGDVKPPTSYSYSHSKNMACYVYAMKVRAYADLSTPQFDVLEQVNEGSSLRARGTKTKIEPAMVGFTEGYIPGPCVTCERFGKKPNTNGMPDIYPNCIDRGTSQDFSSQKVYSFDGVRSDIKLELENSLIRYNYEDTKGFLDLINNAEGWRLWPEVAAKDGIVDEFKFATGMVVPFKYDRVSKSWKVGEHTTPGIQGVLVYYDKDFTLKNGENKQFEVTVVRNHPGFGDEVNKFIYNLAWDNEAVQDNNNQSPVDGVLQVNLKEMKNVSAQTYGYDTQRKYIPWSIPIKYEYPYSLANSENRACYTYKAELRGTSGFATMAHHKDGSSLPPRSATAPDVLAAAKCVGTNTALPIGESKEYVYTQNKKEMYLSFKHSLLRYNIESGGGYESNMYGYRLWAEKAQKYGAIDEFVFAKDTSFSLIYNRAQEAWVFANATPYSDSAGSTTVIYDAAFQLKKGESKELRIGFEKVHPGKAPEKTEFVYELKWN